MARQSNRKLRGGPKSPGFPKHLLLPLPLDYVHQLSLQNHLALVGCERQLGIRHSFNEVIRVMYLTYILWELGYGETNPKQFLAAELILDEAVVRGENTGFWYLEK